jgi:hypothetical protein
MVALRSSWIDCCCNPQHYGLVRVAQRCCDTLRCASSGPRSPCLLSPSFVCVKYDYPDQARLPRSLLRHESPAQPVLMLTEYHSEALAVRAYAHRA